MANKFKALSEQDDEKLADAVLASAQQIWQAGLGAFVIAEQEGGKVFAKLLKEGTNLQKRTRRLAEIKVSGVTDTVTKMADNVSKQATGSWDKLEQVLEDRVARTLASLGVPTSRDIQTLAMRVDDLSKALAALSAKKPLAVKSTAKAAVTGRSVVKATPKAAKRKTSSSPAGATKAVSKTVTTDKRTPAKLTDSSRRQNGA